MKRTFVCLAALLLLLCAAACAEPLSFDFEDGVNPGFFQSGQCKLTVSDRWAHGGGKALLVSGRAQNDWDAADFSSADLGISGGDRVTVSFWAYHEGAEEGVIGVGYAGGSYATVVSAIAQPGQWTLVEGSFVMDATVQNLRFKTDGSLAGADYALDDIVITVSGAGAQAQPTATPAPRSLGVVYHSDFSNGTDGWYARGAQNTQVAVTAHGLTVTGREQSWHSPGRDFPFKQGERYAITATVLQNETYTADMMISIAYTQGGQEFYTQLGRAFVRKGEATTITAAYSADDCERYTLYVETAMTGTLPFTVTDFAVERVSSFGGYPMDIPALKDVYAEHFDFGCALGQGEARNRMRMEFYASQFNIMTHGNELKPDSVLDVATSRRLAAAGDETAAAVHFGSAVPLLDYAKRNGIKIHGHVLLWHSQTPAAFFRQGYDTSKPFVTREVMIARLDNYIRGVMEYMDENYPGLIVSWDVVNEAIDDGTGKLRKSSWTDVVGQDFVEIAFALARKYAPEGTMLYYNDYNTPNEPKLTGICELLDRLIAQGTVDGYGFQAHFSENSPTPTALRRAMQRVADKGLLLRVSELDVTIGENSAQRLRAQAYRYKALMEVFLEFSDSLVAVHTWGISDDLSWRASQHPLLFDRNSQPKEAFWALVDENWPDSSGQ